MRLAPEVNRFIRNRDYERPEQTTLQKGADLLGKAAVIGGTLAAAHALGGGFRGEGLKGFGNIAKGGPKPPSGGGGLDFSVSGGPAPSGGGPSGDIDLGGVVSDAVKTVLPDKADGSAQIVSAGDKADDFLAKLQTPPVRPAVEGEQLPINAFNVPKEAWGSLNEAEKQMQARNVYGDELSKAERVALHRQYDTIQRDQRSVDYPELDSEGATTQKKVDDFLASRYQQATEESLGGRYVGQGTPLPLNERPSGPPPPPAVISETPPVVPSKGPDYSAWDDELVGGSSESPQTYDQYVGEQPSQNALIAQADDLVDQIQAKQTIVVPADDPAVQRVEGTVSAQPKGAFGRALARVGSRARRDAGTLIQAIDQEPFGAQKEKAAARDLGLMIAGRGLGLGPQGGRAVGSGFNPGATQGIFNLPGVSAVTGPLGQVRDAIGSVGGWTIPYTGQVIPTIAQAGSSFLSSHPLAADLVNAGGVTAAEGIGLGAGLLVGGAAKDAAKVGIKVGQAVAPFHNQVLVPAGRAAAGFHGSVLVPGGRQFHNSVLVPGGRRLASAATGFHTNVLVPGGNAALDGIQRNMNALRTSADQQFNITGKVGAVSDYILPTTRETGEVVPGRRLLDHPDMGPLEQDTAPSRAIQVAEDAFRMAAANEPGSLTPDDVFIRTDIESKEPANVRTWAGEKAPSARRKAEFVANLRDRDAEMYDRNELPSRREGRGYNWRTGTKKPGGSAGLAGSLSGVIDYSSPDDKPMTPLEALASVPRRWIEGVSQELTPEERAQFEAARKLGGSIADREV